MTSSKNGQSSITIRCTAQEHTAIEKKARAYGLSLSEYVRLVCINASISVTVESSQRGISKMKCVYAIITAHPEAFDVVHSAWDSKKKADKKCAELNKNDIESAYYAVQLYKISV